MLFLFSQHRFSRSGPPFSRGLCLRPAVRRSRKRLSSTPHSIYFSFRKWCVTRIFASSHTCVICGRLVFVKTFRHVSRLPTILFVDGPVFFSHCIRLKTWSFYCLKKYHTQVCLNNDFLFTLFMYVHAHTHPPIVFPTSMSPQKSRKCLNLRQVNQSSKILVTDSFKMNFLLETLSVIYRLKLKFLSFMLALYSDFK